MVRTNWAGWPFCRQQLNSHNFLLLGNENMSFYPSSPKTPAGIRSQLSQKKEERGFLLTQWLLDSSEMRGNEHWKLLCWGEQFPWTFFSRKSALHDSRLIIYSAPGFLIGKWEKAANNNTADASSSLSLWIIQLLHSPLGGGGGGVKEVKKQTAMVYSPKFPSPTHFSQKTSTSLNVMTSTSKYLSILWLSCFQLS